MNEQPIPENDVLIGTALWLHENGWQIKQISMASGQNIDQAANKRKIVSEFSRVGIKLESIRFMSNGPDIEALQENKKMKIECKGMGEVRIQTLRNNFDRAVASAVSYYDLPIEANLQIGLAVPEAYLKLIKTRLPQPLRERINLWLFLYVAINEIYAFKPGEAIDS